MIKKYLLVFLLVLAYNSSAQEGTASPYSYYGVGSVKFKGTIENRSMGGLSIYNDSIHVNLKNPSAYTGNNIKFYNNESRPVKFTMGGTYTNLKLESATDKDKASTATFDYLALVLPLGKFGAGFGIIPYSSVGYKLESKVDDNLDYRFTGEGGLNKVFFGLAYQFTEGLSIGVDASYNFGNTRDYALKFNYDEFGAYTQFLTEEFNRSDLSGMSYNFGINYKKYIADKFELVFAATYAPKVSLASENVRTFSTVSYNQFTETTINIDTQEVDLDSRGLANSSVDLPSKYSFGAGIGQPRIWFVGAEYTQVNTNEFNNPTLNLGNSKFVNAETWSIGGFVVPDYNSFSNYWKRIVYRAGLRYSGLGLNINNEDINEFGITFGAGLPIGGTFSSANLGFEFGERGTTKADLIKEKYFNIHLSLTLNSRWFQKRKYN